MKQLDLQMFQDGSLFYKTGIGTMPKQQDDK